MDGRKHMNNQIYLDNAATSHPKPEVVYQAVDRALRVGASAGRGMYQQALSAERLVFETRELLASFFNVVESAGFVFTPNATAGINQALFGLLRPGDRVVTTNLEHNAVVRPLRVLQDHGVEIVKVAADPDSGRVAANDLKQSCLVAPTRLLLVNHCSNVFGAIQPIEGLGRWCHEQGILFMVDGSQTAGCMPIDLQALEVDLFAAPGHKGLLGPQGTGLLYIADNLQLTPLLYGGTGGNSHSDQPPESLPERLECGTLNLPGIAGLQAGVGYLQELGCAQVRQRELQAIEHLIRGLGEIEAVQLFGPEAIDQRGAPISFLLRGYDPAEVGFLLDQENVCIRVGLHCAPDAHRSIGTYPQGTVRVSPGLFTGEAEIDQFLKLIRQLAKSEG